MKTTLSILKQIYAPDTGLRYAYLYTAASIQDEILHFKELLATISSDDELYPLLREHLLEAQEIADIMYKTMQLCMATQRPPNPCPGGGSSSCLFISDYYTYYSRVSGDLLKYAVNGKDYVVLECEYNDLIKIQTVKIQDAPIYHEGDSVRLEIPVTYRDANGNLIREVIIHVASDPQTLTHKL